MKIVILGAGAYDLAPALLDDLFVQTHTVCDLWLVDRSLDVAELTARAAQALAKAAAIPARFFYTANAAKALAGADYVLWCRDPLSPEAFARDLKALDDIGLGKQMRPFGGIGGALATLREGGLLMDLCELMQRECPQAVLVVASGPVARLCEVAQRFGGIRALGLSRAPYDAAQRLRALLGASMTPQVVCAGTSCFSWVLAAKLDGRDALVDAKRRLLQDAADSRAREKKHAEEASKAQAEPAKDLRLSFDEMLGAHKEGKQSDFVSAQYVDWYDAMPATGAEWQMLRDTPESPRLSALPQAFGEAGQELRLRRLASIAVHGPAHPEGRAAFEAMLQTSGPLRPMQLVHALSGRAPALCVPGLVRPCDGSIPCVADGRFIEAPAVVAQEGISARPMPAFPMALEELLDRVTQANLLYAQAAAYGDRVALREALEADPATDGIDLLYALDTVDDMIEQSRDALTRF